MNRTLALRIQNAPNLDARIEASREFERLARLEEAHYAPEGKALTTDTLEVTFRRATHFDGFVPGRFEVNSLGPKRGIGRDHIALGEVRPVAGQYVAQAWNGVEFEYEPEQTFRTLAAAVEHVRQ